jgi:hypothetical protein
MTGTVGTRHGGEIPRGFIFRPAKADFVRARERFDSVFAKVSFAFETQPETANNYRNIFRQSNGKFDCFSKRF